MILHLVSVLPSFRHTSADMSALQMDYSFKSMLCDFKYNYTPILYVTSTTQTSTVVISEVQYYSSCSVLTASSSEHKCFTTGQLTQWLKSYSTSSSGPQHLPSGDRQEWHRLQSEVETLQQQLDSIQQQKDAEIARLQVTTDILT